MATDLAKLVVRLEAQSAQLLTELEKANKKIDRFAAQTSKTLNKWAGNLLGVFSAQAIIRFGVEVLKAQGDLVAMAEVANTSVENLSGLGYAAEQSASSLETLNKGLGELANKSADAQKGTKSAQDAFKTLGITVESTDGRLKDSADLLLEIADQFAQYEDGAAKAALAQDLFGKSGKELIPLLNRGRDGIEELTKRADELGITVSTEAAEAANQFNDQLATLGAITKGVVGQALAEVVPILSKFAEGAISGAGASDRLDQSARVLAAGLKLLLSAGVIVGEIFDRIGDAIGAAAAAVVAIAEGEFQRAWDIMNDNSEQAAISAQQAADDLYTVWSEAGNRIADSAKAADAEVKKTLIFGGKGASELEEIKITLDKIEPTGMEKFFEELNQLTRTSTEVAASAYAEQKVALDALYGDGKITLEQFNARLVEINKSYEDAIGITERQEQAAERLKRVQDEGRQVFEATRTPLEKYDAELVRLSNLLSQNAIDQETYNRAVGNAEEAYKKATDGATKFYDEAKENAQDILGQGLYDSIKDGFDRGADEALKSFGDMLLRMATEALAADIMGKLFGTGQQTTTGGTDSGWIGTALSAIGTFFGGGRAMTGPVNPGTSYMVGETGPERFVPDRPGRIEDARGSGGLRMTNVFQVSTPTGRVPLETQLQMANRMAGALATARKRNG